MKTNYQILFSIELLHDYYNHRETFDDIEIIPTGITKKIMDGYRILCKTFSNKLVALIEVDGSEKPNIKIDNDTSLRFILKLKNPAFQNISALKIFDLNNNIYYFTNRADNEKGGIHYLSKTIPVHNTGEDYEVGSLIQDSTNIYEAVINNIGLPPPNNSWRILSPQRFPAYNPANHSDINKGTIVFETVSSKNYEALKFIPQGQTIQVTDVIYWKEVSAFQYVTSEDLIDKNFIAIKEYDIFNHVDIYKGDILFYAGDSKLYKALKFIERGNAVLVSETNYWQVVNDSRFVISEDLIDPNENIFGVIDLFFDSSVSANYAILEASDKVKKLNYVIRFKNRITTWKYVSQNNTTTSISDNNGIFTFVKTNNEFISNTPIPLLASPIQNFKLTTPVLTLDHLKCASSFINPESETKSFLSEIFLNY
jgi:hypothetical protein